MLMKKYLDIRVEYSDYVYDNIFKVNDTDLEKINPAIEYLQNFNDGDGVIRDNVPDSVLDVLSNFLPPKTFFDKIISIYIINGNKTRLF